MTSVSAIGLLATCLALVPTLHRADVAWAELDCRGFNAIWCERLSGDLYISNGKTIHITRDQGESWTEAVAPQEKGRHFNSIGFDGGARANALALFPIDSPVGWLTTDNGATWKSFPKPTPPQVGKHDGWTYGTVNWADETPTRLFAKDHHSSRLWLSVDSGQSWKQITSAGGYWGIGLAQDGSLLVGVTIDDKAKLPDGATEAGIYRSTDDGETWSLVLTCTLHQKVKPAVIGERIYWPTLEGIAVSTDNGTSWKLLADSPRDVRYGPYVGLETSDLLAVSQEGVFRSDDNGVTWRKLLSRDALPKPVADGNFRELKPNFAWDARNNVLYATSQGVAVFKANLPD